MASYNTEERLCVKCGEPSSKGNVLSQVGAPKGRRKGICENDPLEKLIEQSEKLKLEELTKIYKNNKATHEPTYIHSTCRTFMNNKTRANFLQFHLDFCFFVFSNLLIYCILLSVTY